MTGKTKTFNSNAFLIEYSHFIGSEKEIYHFLHSILKNVLGKVKFALITEHQAKKNKLFANSFEFFLKCDSCANFFEYKNHKKIFNLISKNKKASFIKAYPVRKIVLNKKITALLFTESTDINTEILIELLLNITSMKLEISSFTQKGMEFSKYYNFGKACPQIFHEIKNKLIAPSTFLQTFPKKLEDKKFMTHFSDLALKEIKTIQMQIEHSLQYGKSLQTHAHGKKIGFEKILNTCLTLLAPQILKKNIHITIKTVEDYILPLPTNNLKDILFNLILNSIDSISGKLKNKHILISAFSKEKAKGFTIEDSGKGIAKSALHHLFEPFYTTKSKGTGLGLNIVKNEVESFGGTIKVNSSPDKGTKITVSFNK